jgi:two-component system CheB/CheR fusion protein
MSSEYVAFPIVGIGASAGGLEAFRDVLRFLPADTGMAYVLVQHLDPRHESLLPDLLDRVTRMQVHEAREDMEVCANHVYVIAPNTDMTLSPCSNSCPEQRQVGSTSLLIPSCVRWPRVEPPGPWG